MQNRKRQAQSVSIIIHTHQASHKVRYTSLGRFRLPHSARPGVFFFFRCVGQGCTPDTRWVIVEVAVDRIGD